MTGKERKARLTALGYRLVRNYFCPIRRKRMAYARLPLSSGSVCVFDTLEQVDHHIADVEKVRSWQEEVTC